MSDFMMFSLVPMTVAVIISMTCALLGNFLVLRRQSPIGDAISHVALPGIVVSFLLTGMLASTSMMLGAGASALITGAMIELIRRLGRVEISAAMGVTFTSLFAVGAASVRARPVLVDLLLVTLVAVAAIAAFEAVGSIIVIAMFICPAAAARLMTNRLGIQIALSQLLAFVSAVMGYLVAGYGPGWIGFDMSVSAAGMIATLAGLILLLACLFGPQRQRAGAAPS